MYIGLLDYLREFALQKHRCTPRARIPYKFT